MQLQSSILKVIAYFDLFSYPLAMEDILYFLDTDTDEHAVRRETANLVHDGCLFRTGNYYSLRDDPTLAEKRNRGQLHADEMFPIARKGARLLYQFPFVRGVFISGSLSKRCADDKADIDYFILTAAGRLWIARTLMHLFKKLSYLRGHQHRYCMNYYVDEDAMEIREKNIFTATELLTLIPASGEGSIASFFLANEWATRFYPRYRQRNRVSLSRRRASLVKRACEKLLDNRLGDRLEVFLRNVTASRWKKKEDRGERNMRGLAMSLQCSRHYARPNPEIFQQMVLNRYQRKLKDLSAQWGPVSF
ncbi:MAG TPA: hypothetical protein VGR89_16945 [Puia sp.]|nr:hypothetical protein [Puia sp.]